MASFLPSGTLYHALFALLLADQALGQLITPIGTQQTPVPTGSPNTQILAEGDQTAISNPPRNQQVSLALPVFLTVLTIGMIIGVTIQSWLVLRRHQVKAFEPYYKANKVEEGGSGRDDAALAEGSGLKGRLKSMAQRGKDKSQTNMAGGSGFNPTSPTELPAHQQQAYRSPVPMPTRQGSQDTVVPPAEYLTPYGSSKPFVPPGPILPYQENRNIVDGKGETQLRPAKSFSSVSSDSSVSTFLSDGAPLRSKFKNLPVQPIPQSPDAPLPPLPGKHEIEERTVPTPTPTLGGRKYGLPTAGARMDSVRPRANSAAKSEVAQSPFSARSSSVPPRRNVSALAISSQRPVHPANVPMSATTNTSSTIPKGRGRSNTFDGGAVVMVEDVSFVLSPAATTAAERFSMIPPPPAPATTGRSNSTIRRKAPPSINTSGIATQRLDETQEMDAMYPPNTAMTGRTQFSSALPDSATLLPGGVFALSPTTTAIGQSLPPPPRATAPSRQGTMTRGRAPGLPANPRARSVSRERPARNADADVDARGRSDASEYVWRGDDENLPPLPSPFIRRDS